MSKRVSLAGVDNDHGHVPQNMFAGKVVLRKNSSVHIDMLYNDFYKKLQTTKVQGVETPDAAKFLEDKRKHSAVTGGRNSIVNLLRRATPSREEPVGDKYNVDPENEALLKSKDYGFKTLEATTEAEESEEEDDDGGAGAGGDMQSRRPFTSPMLRSSYSEDQFSVGSTDFEIFDNDGNQVSPELLALARRKSMQANSAGTTLRFRNKSILSYRDAIEG